MRPRRPVRNAVTLIELLAVLVLLGISAGVVGLTLHTARPVTAIDPVQASIRAARDSSVRSGHPVTVEVSAFGSLRPVTAFPDGHVTADRSLHVDELSGVADVAR